MLDVQSARQERPRSIEDNVVTIEPADGGAMVLFGLAHMGLVHGYAAHVRKGDDGTWSLTEVVRLPRDAQAMTTIGPNLFAGLERWQGGGLFPQGGSRIGSVHPMNIEH